ncbi:MAG TPA: SDR family oxidoreductase [Nevskiaceae bacterium]|nr:SDR family oxidoreductase [Nevskiaceae bacterium]
MQIRDRVAIVTGGGGGIGSAIATALAARGARVVVADLRGAPALAVAERINSQYPNHACGVAADVTEAEDIGRTIKVAEDTFGPVELYFANAGVSVGTGIASSEPDWDLATNVNLRAHIRAARLLVPEWIKRGSGYFVSTASAAGLLTELGSVVYSVTKHAAVAFAEWLNITYGDQGIHVSCLCPMGVNTHMLFPERGATDPLDKLGQRAVTAAGNVLEPSVVATAVLAAIEEERFLILPHPEVIEMFRHKSSDYDRWLTGMRRYRKRLLAEL